MSKSQEKRLAIQDASKSHTYELLCEILGLCFEKDIYLQVNPDKKKPYITLSVNTDDAGILGFVIYRFTHDTPSPELEKAIIDLKTYKEKHND